MSNNGNAEKRLVGKGLERDCRLWSWKKTLQWSFGGAETAVGWGVNGWGRGDAQEARHVDSLFDFIVK